MDCKQTHRHTDDWHRSKQINTRKQNSKKTTLSVVNAGPPDMDYLYYPVNNGGDTLKVSLLPTHKG